MGVRRNRLRIVAMAVTVIGFIFLQMWWWDIGLPGLSSRTAGVGSVTPTGNAVAKLPPKRRLISQLQPVAIPVAALRFPRDATHPRPIGIPVATLRFPRYLSAQHDPILLSIASLPNYRPLKPSASQPQIEFDPVVVSVARLPWLKAGESLAALREDDRRKENVDAGALAIAPPKLSKDGGPLFVTALAKDQEGNLWVGGEENGVFRYYPQTGQWQQFQTKDGLGDDNAYAIAVDRRNRIWVGHLNHGISVYNGQKWQRYEAVGGLSNAGALSGPLGERVFTMAVCPTDGDMWIATSAGLCRYSDRHDKWSYYTRAEGLPSDQAAALAFDPQGNIYVGTQCDGIAMADAKDDYRSWRVARGQDRPPVDPAGEGLPSSLINDVLVARDGTVYAATVTGLARSADRGRTWKYDRGSDWAIKVRGLIGGPPKGWTERRGAWLTEDNIACLAENDKGLWLGHRQEGWELISGQIGKVLDIGLPKKLITRILPTALGPVVGTYGDGLMMPLHLASATPLGSKPAVAALPQGAQPPTDAELVQMLNRLKAMPASAGADRVAAILLDEDWRTRGDWLGRYGRHWVCSCSLLAHMDSQHDYFWGAAPSGEVACYANVGPQFPEDWIRHWVHWLYTTNPRCLEIPPMYLHSRVLYGYTTWEKNRRQCEWDDHGENYPRTQEGPDIYCNLSIPKGTFYLSLYDVNKDGHTGSERARDYLVSIRPWSESGTLRSFVGFDQQPELARTRIRDFWGGCYKRFLVQGPAKLTIRISRNYCINAILAAVMLDSVEQFPQPYFADQIPAPSPATTAADQLADQIDRLLKSNPKSVMELAATDVQLLRWHAGKPAPHNLSASLRSMGSMYRLRCFESWEMIQKELGLTTARQIEKSLRWDRSMPNCSGNEAVILAKKLSASDKSSMNGPSLSKSGTRN